MPVRNYGVWVGTPTRYKAETNEIDSRSPHLTLWFSDSSSTREIRAAINVKSISTDSRLVYWITHDFQHPITSSLSTLEPGFHPIPGLDNSNSDLAIDYARTNPPLLNFSEGQLLPHDIPGPNNDILDNLIPIVENAIASGSGTVYLFGSSFGTGIHDIHMNQGSLPRFDNGVFQDGAMIFHSPEKDRFEAVFLAFASQRVPTDDVNGLALEGSEPLSEMAKVVGMGAGIREESE